MAAGEIHVDDIGTAFVVTLKDQDGNAVDVSAADIEFLFRAPDKTVTSKTGIIS